MRAMKVYFAPLESITVYTLRNCFNKHFPNVDRYYIPFLSPMGEGRLINKSLRDIDPVNNKMDKELIPQIISNDAQSTLSLIKQLQALGYKEVNLNFGCPSGTVTSKEKGSGILRNLARLESYLKEVTENSPLPISVKTRIGWCDPNEFEDILNIYNKFPLKELIIHPRTAKEMYSGPLHLDVLDDLDKKTNIPVVFNGEIKCRADIDYIIERYPYIQAVMIGRGFLECPDMLSDLPDHERRQSIEEYVKELTETYIKERGWGNGSYGVKEIWAYLSKRFDLTDKEKKALFKERDLNSFRALQDKALHAPLKDIKPTFK